MFNFIVFPFHLHIFTFFVLFFFEFYDLRLCFYLTFYLLIDIELIDLLHKYVENVVNMCPCCYLKKFKTKIIFSEKQFNSIKCENDIGKR